LHPVPHVLWHLDLLPPCQTDRIFGCGLFLGERDGLLAVDGTSLLP